MDKNKNQLFHGTSSMTARINPCEASQKILPHRSDGQLIFNTVSQA